MLPSYATRLKTPVRGLPERFRRVRALHLHARLAASANLHAAVCLAPSAGTSPLVVPMGRQGEALAGLPIAALDLTAEQSERLALWGLRTVGELAALEETALVVRLGQEGKRLRALARGEYQHLMVPEEPVFALQEFLLFDSPIELLDSLLFVVGPMLDQLLSRAARRAYALASVTVKLGLDGGGEHERTVKPAVPLMQRETLLKLLHLDLQAHPPGAGVMSVAVHAEAGDRSKVQLGLFAPQLPEPVRLDVTLARIAALVELIVQSIQSFALYGFPESHAASFALIAYASAYFKVKFLAAFTCAMLNNQPMGFYTPAVLVKDAQRHKLRVKPVDVQVSGTVCTVEHEASGSLSLRMGLNYAKEVRSHDFH